MNVSRLTGIIVAIAIILILVVVIFRNQGPSGPPLPDLNDIASIEASFYNQREKKEVAFTVQPKDFKPIFDALTPAVYDTNPAKWMVLGELNVILKNGEGFHISLYSVGNGPGAFASGPTFKTRTYYRGGNSNNLETTLNAAFDATTKENTKSAD